MARVSDIPPPIPAAMVEFMDETPLNVWFIQ